MLNNRILLSVDVASSAQSNLRARYEGGQHDGRLFVLIDFADEAKVIEVLASRNAIKSKGSAASEIKVIEV